MAATTTSSASRIIPDEQIFQKDPPAEIPAAGRELFEKYSGIDPDHVRDHVLTVRNRLFEVCPYPCIGRWRFLDVMILTSPVYHEVLQRLKNGEKMLDMGCCVGQGIRRLAFDGAPSENLYGSDLRQEFLDLGYELFKDKDKLKATFLQADVFDPNSNLKQLEGKLDMINAEAFFHLFDLDHQLRAARGLLKLFTGKPGNMFFGMQVGQKVAGERPHRFGCGNMWTHSPDSWREMWAKLGKETGENWQVEVELKPFPNREDWMEEDIGLLTFAMRRL